MTKAGRNEAPDSRNEAIGTGFLGQLAAWGAMVEGRAAAGLARDRQLDTFTARGPERPARPEPTAEATQAAVEEEWRRIVAGLPVNTEPRRGPSQTEQRQAEVAAALAARQRMLEQ